MSSPIVASPHVSGNVSSVATGPDITCHSCGEVPAWAWWFTAAPALPEPVITDWLAANVPHCQCGESGEAVVPAPHVLAEVA